MVMGPYGPYQTSSEEVIQAMPFLHVTLLLRIFSGNIHAIFNTLCSHSNVYIIHSQCSLISVLALNQLQPTAHQNRLPTSICRGGKQIVIDIYELYWWQNWQTKLKTHGSITKCGSTTEELSNLLEHSFYKNESVYSNCSICQTKSV